MATQDPIFAVARSRFLVFEQLPGPYCCAPTSYELSPGLEADRFGHQLLRLGSISCGCELGIGAAACIVRFAYDVKSLFSGFKADWDLLSLCLFWEAV